MLAVDDLEDVEEILEQEEDEGIQLEPFNLAKEREEGHFDEGGNYVEHREEEDASLQDAWLGSKDGSSFVYSFSLFSVCTKMQKHFLYQLKSSKLVFSSSITFVNAYRGRLTPP